MSASAGGRPSLDSEVGEITLGVIHHSSLRYTAIANDGHTLLVALVRNRGETLHQLLDRLEQALGPALEDQIYVDEINRRGTPEPASRKTGRGVYGSINAPARRRPPRRR
jgi:hypothetical protein